ncbi:protein rolling stone isoform X2 [Anastrepha obliqua]|uniref:protein rolling stone isoform X2 n=1 Tax=Anastrepha obliqua TaxID=95512 RepID=UPI002408FB37|nr:protein rolling stone isoform X2 [Anastrepha obliqua]XP_054743295.1 protein rolling stone isoform X2 [Anastrepha obliqua]XP_054743296.1 protein rolling stone isoform X2 [Anastrepha obliqua]XP_054743298.1 protein rolling stone isoform X2 [Anastrepha obliqua]
MRIKQSFARSFLNEFKLRKFGFNYNHLDQFYRSQWQSKERSVYFLLYKWIWACFFISVFTASLVLQLSGGKLFIFLTNWGIILCLLTQISGAVLATRWHFNSGGARSVVIEARTLKEPPPTPKLVQFYWWCHGVGLSLALIITTVYWIFLHGKMNKPMRYPVLSFVTHCLNSVFMLVDFFVVAFPVRVLHVIYWMLLPIIYYLFTVVYFIAGGLDEYGNHYVYPILDWTTPARAITTFAGVFVLYVIYAIILFALSKFKRYLSRTLNAMDSPHAIGLI